MLIKHHHKPGYEPGMSQNQPAIHWNDVLPPPPNHLHCGGKHLQDDQLYSEIPDDQTLSPISPVTPAQRSAYSHHFQVQNFNKEANSDSCNRCQSLKDSENRPYYRPSDMCRADNTLSRSSNQEGGTPVYLHGYSQPWDSQPLPSGAYDYAQVLEEDSYNYTQPIQDGLTDPFINPEHFSSSFTQPQRDFSNSPRGPPGNYCEACCRGQFNNLSTLSNSYHRTRGEQSQYLDNYKLDSQPSNCSEYRICNSGNSQTESSVGSIKSEGCVRERSSERNNAKHLDVVAEIKCRPLMCHTR